MNTVNIALSPSGVNSDTDGDTKNGNVDDDSDGDKVRDGDETFYCDPGGFAYLPSKVPHAFLNLTDEPGEVIVVYTPGGGHKFYEEFGPISRNGPPDPKVLGPLFEKYGMTLLGKPLSAD